MTQPAVMSPLWRPFSKRYSAESEPLLIERGEGFHVFDTSGRRYIDATSGLWFANIGHGRQEVVDAVADQMRRIGPYSTFSEYSNVPATELAERLAALAPVDDPRIFLTSGGSESVDSAAKLALRFWAAQGSPEKTTLISRRECFHGMAGYGQTLAGITANREGVHGVAGHRLVPHDDAGALAAAIDEEGPARVAAFFVEPVMGAGGMIPPAPGYLAEVADICRERDVLLVVDEVITAFGRLGHWFASEWMGVRPDIITCAKGLGAGYFPVGAVIVSGRIAEPFEAPERKLMFRHGHTFSGSAPAAVAALACLDGLEREALLDRVQQLAPVLDRELEPLRGHGAVAEVRNIGLTAAVELAPELTVDPLPELIVRRLWEEGVLTRMIGGPSVLICPPFVISEDALSHVVGAIGTSLSWAVERAGSVA